jgi:hypothetical protein
MRCLRHGDCLREFDLQKLIAHIGLRPSRIDRTGEFDGAKNVLQRWMDASRYVVWMTRMPVAAECDAGGSCQISRLPGANPPGSVPMMTV